MNISSQVFTSGPHRWHALKIPPMKETHAEKWLKVRGVDSFHPVQTIKRFRHGKKIYHKRRYLPGYVFADFPGEAKLHELFKSPFIHDMIRLSNGEPAILDPRDLSLIIAMRDVDEARQANRLAAKRIRARDRVRVSGGPFEGTEAEVIELRSGNVVIPIRMFGVEREAVVAADMLEKI